MHCRIVNYSHHVVHYILRTYLSYNWKFVPFDYLPPTPPSPPATASANAHLFSLARVPNLWNLMPRGLNEADIIKIEIKYTINVMHLNHLKTILPLTFPPPAPAPITCPWKKVYRGTVPGAKKVGDNCLWVYCIFKDLPHASYTTLICT